MSDPVPITIYRRHPCELCEDALETIESVAEAADVEVAIEQIGVDSDSDFRERYGDSVPVVFIDGEKQFEVFVDQSILLAVLQDAA